MRTRTLEIVALALILSAVAPASAPRAQQPDGNDGGGAAGVLVPTDHPRLPQDLSQLWLAPPSLHHGHSLVENELITAVKLEVDEKFAQALPILLQPAMQQGSLGAYAIYFAALAHLRLGRHEEARSAFQALEAQRPVGYLSEAAALGLAECDEALGDPAAALAVYERLSKVKTAAPDDLLMRLGRAAKAAGDRDKAVAAFSRVYYEFPLSDLSSLAGDELDLLRRVSPVAAGSAQYRLELDRAERLFAARRYASSKKAFAGIRRASSGDDHALVSLRIAECDYYLKRLRSARDGIRPYVDQAPRQSEALYFYALATRGLGGRDEYLKTVRRIAIDFPDEPWAQEALNNLASYLIVEDEDGEADAVFRELYGKYPTGRYAERAAWKIGWFAYRNGQYSETVRVFEKAALDFPRSDYRPSWLYWAGRSHEALKDRPLAEARYALVATDYLNSYYGRLAASRLDGRVPRRQLVVDEGGNGSAAAPGTSGDIELAPVPPNGRLVRALLSEELYDQAIDELRYAQKVWGDSPVIQATLGWAYNQRGDLRPGINAMKRAYPQYLAAGGEHLPAEILRVLFPIDYWPLIQRYSTERDLDPYLVAALIAQESTFTADIRSSANAYGLMQIVPATGRRYAKAVGLKRFSIGLLKTPEPNVRMGTAYFSNLVKRFGGIHLALASYNAGEHRVVRWVAERPGVDRDEFIDDIPFPETQNYVKRILGTAEDYRRLYGPGASSRAGEGPAAAPAVASATAPTSSASTRVPSAGSQPSGARTRKAAAPVAKKTVAPGARKTVAPAAKKKTRKSA